MSGARALRIIVTGLVQGIGFRPTIYRIARETGVNGYVRNLGGSEVEIHVEGDSSSIEAFIDRLNNDLPPVALIEDISIEEVEGRGLRGFTILPSLDRRLARSIIPPDFSICEDCLREVYDPGSRWYMYPFNSCAYCGPRYSMMADTPYDREKTSMADFPLCGDCMREYGDPGDYRRFHAQGISCPRCGPRVWLVDRDGSMIDVDDPIREAARLIDEGYILSIKGLGGFHIASLASDDGVVLRLRVRKNRPQKPFAIMARDLEILERLVVLSDRDREILRSPQHPILLLVRRGDAPVSRHVAPGLRELGVFLPYTALHYILLGYTRDKYLIMTSGNPIGEPMCIRNWDAVRRLRGIVDYHLLHNRRITNRMDDSVLRYTLDRLVFLRRGRGYAPRWIRLGFTLDRPVIAFGAMLQNTGGIGFSDKAVLTQYIGDCEDLRTLKDLQIYIGRLIKMYRINLEGSTIAVDMHPKYPTLELAMDFSEKHGLGLVRIQHHWAHIASVMAEHRIVDQAVGIAIDGAGYGDDGAIWGGEVLEVGLTGYRRIGHIEYIPMIGGELATIYPVRILTAILSRIMSEDEIVRLFKGNGLIGRCIRDVGELHMILRQMDRDNPLTSSLGRVLDAASILLGASSYRSYEGEPAMKLESFSTPGEYILEPYISNTGDGYILDITRIFEDIVSIMDEGLDKRIIAYSIQRVLGEGLAEIALRRARDLIIVSGGAAVNNYVLEGIVYRARMRGVKVLLNRDVPPGDGGISLGQIAIAGKYMP